MIKKILIALAIIFVGIQFIPVDRSNPPVTQEINTPEKVSIILETSCYDCHSNETNWPWYAYVAPVSFFVAGDVNTARKHLNFSEWDKYDEKRKSKKLDGIVELVEKGVMPLSSYTFLHTDAKLNPKKVKIIKDWFVSSSSENEPVRYKKEEEIEND